MIFSYLLVCFFFIPPNSSLSPVHLCDLQQHKASQFVLHELCVDGNIPWEADQEKTGAASLSQATSTCTWVIYFFSWGDCEELICHLGPVEKAPGLGVRSLQLPFQLCHYCCAMMRKQDPATVKLKNCKDWGSHQFSHSSLPHCPHKMSPSSLLPELMTQLTPGWAVEISFLPQPRS